MVLSSEHIDRMPIQAVVAEMARLERFLFLKKYLHTDDRNFVMEGWEYDLKLLRAIR